MPRRPPGKLVEAAQALYDRAPTAAELNAAGLTREDYETDTVEIWPENWQAFELFEFLRTQWRTNMGGPTGLDYNVLHRELDDLGLVGDERQEMKATIREMEFAALSTMNKK